MKRPSKRIQSNRPRVLLHLGPALEEKMNAALREPIQQEALLEAYEEFLKLQSAVRRALPLTPANEEDYEDLLWRFTTDPHALGLPRGEFNIPSGVPSNGHVEITYEDWLEQYRRYVKVLGKYAPKGEPGAPLKDTTTLIREKWRDLRYPKPTASVCDKIGASVFPEPELKPGTAPHRARRELVRNQIKRTPSHLLPSAT